MSHLLWSVISHNPTRILTKEKEERGACKYNLKQCTYAVRAQFLKMIQRNLFYTSVNVISLRVFESDGYRLLPTINFK